MKKFGGLLLYLHRLGETGSRAQGVGAAGGGNTTKQSIMGRVSFRKVLEFGILRHSPGGTTPLNAINRLASAVKEGRVLSGLWRRLGPLREFKLRVALRQSQGVRQIIPLIQFHGDSSASPEGIALKESFDKAQQGACRLPDEIRGIEGMSGQKYRTLINSLVRTYADPRYLEIGSWSGSTATAALHGNTAQALCIDNWSQFGGPRSEFFSNMGKVLSEDIKFGFLEQDFRRVDYRAIGLFNIYLFDGPHEEADQYQGVTIAQPALLDPFILIVDDWNWRAVRIGTFRGLVDAKCRVEFSIEIRTTRDNTHPLVWGKASEWHNGYFLAVVRKG